MRDARNEYTERRAARVAAHSVEEQRHWRIGTARLIGFGLTLALGLGMIGGAPYQAWWLFMPLVGVFCLGIWLDRIEATRSRLRRAITFYEHGLARLDGKWSGTGPNGRQFAATTSHLYAADLDLFGDGSIFQLLCRARTSIGETMLANWLLAPATPAVIAQRQHAVDELVHHLDLREDLSALGDEAREVVDHTALHAWADVRPEVVSRNSSGRDARRSVSASRPRGVLARGWSIARSNRECIDSTSVVQHRCSWRNCRHQRSVHADRRTDLRRC